MIKTELKQMCRNKANSGLMFWIRILRSESFICEPRDATEKNPDKMLSEDWLTSSHHKPEVLQLMSTDAPNETFCIDLPYARSRATYYKWKFKDKICPEFIIHVFLYL